MHKFCCVIFSFNRAMQLDLTLRSLTEMLENPHVAYTVIYDCTSLHKNSYEQLIREWTNKNICFKRCDRRYRSFRENFKYLLQAGNLYRFLKIKSMRTRFDNFKELVEETIRESKAPFTFFSTDDQYLFKSTYIPEKALQCIADDPTNVSFRLGMSDRLKNERALPEKIKVNRLDYDENEYQGTLLTWDARDPNATKLWEYSFNVDFQIYQSDALLDFLSPILYHIPTTLEYAGLRVARKNDRFRKLIGTTEKTIIGMQLNLAQTLVNNVAANFSLDALSSLYTQGYRLTIPKEQLTDIDWLFMPQTLFFYKKSQPDTIFEFKDIA